MKKLEYIGNAEIIHSLQDLPKIGEKKTAFFCSGVCYSLEAYEDESHPEYIFYTARFSERLHTENQKYFVFGVDCFSFTYAIKTSEF